MKKNSIISDFLKKNRRSENHKFINKNLDITEQVHAILKEKGWTQSEFAKKLGKSNAEVSKWLSGTHNLTLRSIAKMEAVLGQDIILAPYKAEQKYKKVNYVKVSVPVHLNQMVEERIAYTEVSSSKERVISTIEI